MNPVNQIFSGDYTGLLATIKNRIRTAQTRTILEFVPQPVALLQKDTEQIKEQVREQVREQVKEQVKSMVLKIEHEMSVVEIMAALELKGRRNFLQKYLQPALESGFVEMTQPDSPKSPTQKYRLTEKGKSLLGKIGNHV